MKKVFVKTKNVKQLISMMNRLKEREDGVPGMGLVYGEPGLGKTYAITWWAAQNDAILNYLNNLTREIPELYRKLKNMQTQRLVQYQLRPRYTRRQFSRRL